MTSSNHSPAIISTPATHTGKPSIASVIVWLVALVGPILIISICIHMLEKILVLLLLLAVIMATTGTVGYGIYLGKFHQRLQNIATTAAVGTAALVAWYVLAMILLNPNDPTSDTAAGVGVVILAPPTFATLALLLGAGTGLSLVIPKLQSRLKH